MTDVEDGRGRDVCTNNRTSRTTCSFYEKQRKLITSYVDTWAETGNDQLALQAVRDSDEYETYFPGNYRIDPRQDNRQALDMMKHNTQH